MFRNCGVTARAGVAEAHPIPPRLAPGRAAARGARLGACLGLFLVAVLRLAGPGAASEPPGAPEPPLSVLAAFGYGVTQGAAAGYVDDSSCTICHREIATAYREVGMARSFAAPANAEPIEDFAAEPFYHEASGRYFTMRRTEDGGLRFRRWQVDAEGRERNVLEQEVDWVLGSGHTSRVYLYRTPSGELFQLPLAWYTQDGGHWAMAPGLDGPVHQGVGRRILRECMFCHNAYPEVPEGSDTAGRPHTFPEVLPEGTGCQRCHGPAARHLALAFTGEEDEERLRSTIVNPGRLEPALRNDVCNACHMQPVVALLGVRRFGRPVYSQRPGESLSDYLVQMDATVEGISKEERFEINHHPYRLEQSACFLESRDEGGVSALSCLTCHDPHRKVPMAERAAHYRQACLSCHTVDACSLEAMLEGDATGASEPGMAEMETLDPGDCVACHMPRRRTQDVVHVAMTDHRIVRRPPPATELLAPREERNPVVLETELFRPAEAPEGELGEIYRAVALLQAGAGAPAVDRLRRLLARVGVEESEPWLALAKAQVQQGRYANAEASTGRLLGLLGEGPALLRYWALSRAGRGEAGDAVSLLRRAVKLDPSVYENHYNLGLILFRSGQLAEAEAALRRSVELRPTAAPQRLYLGRVLDSLDRGDEAAEAYRSALAVEPAMDDAYLALAELLHRRGDIAEAVGWLRHGRRWAAEKGEIEALLARWQRDSAGSPDGIEDPGENTEGRR
ncbi:MAG: tetratricopeptide repeat protein [Holophagales bacterium]|nr:tetratricopeptide repeat protein [Holophagales bacterium]